MIYALSVSFLIKKSYNYNWAVNWKLPVVIVLAFTLMKDDLGGYIFYVYLYM